jgi:two-component system, LuxR family, response regulator FixJ
MKSLKPQQRSPIVFIVDDDEAIRNSLRLLVKSIGLNATILGSAQEFLASYDPLQPGCLILDVRMPGMSGLELQQQLNLRGAVIPVIFISGHGDIPMAVEAMQQGAFDFLQKPFRDQDLIDRVQRAMERDRKNRAELSERSRIRERRDSLTPREREVLALVTSGKANKVMAADLGLSQRTVEIHRARVMEKMGASSLAQLVRMVMDLEEAAGGQASGSPPA